MAFIVEAVVSKLTEEVTALAIEQVKEEVNLVVGVEDEVDKLTQNLKAIEAVVIDAEKKQLKDAGIRLWLEDLKEISYEIDDVLDVWRSAILKKSQHQNKVRNLIPSLCFGCCKMDHRHEVAYKIKDINGRLDEIAKRREKYNLVPVVGIRVEEHVKQRTTISDVNIGEVKGRVEENERLVNMLVCASSSEMVVPHIVSIVGMGGLGKTTLAQLAYNNASVKEHFHVRIWVCVSDPFDEIKIARAILESLGGSGKSELQTMVQEIKQEISKKRFLLVLDDVWNEDPNKWKNLKTVLTCGLSGSKILVTTRKDKVAKIMDCVELNLFRSGHLSKEECWSIISNEVALSEMATQDLYELQDIGEQIADKCKGLPLAAKALGSLLRFKVSREEWQSVLGNEMWQLGEEETEIERHVFAPLWLSYHDLSPAERQCLSYCTCFPKDAEVQKDEAIQLWMCQGYLKESETKDLETVGEEYFLNLCARSFFQNFEKDGNGKIVQVTMHDLVHDFVLFVSKKECMSTTLSDDVEELEFVRKAEAARHLMIYSNDRIEKFPHFQCSFKRLRTLAVNNQRRLELSSLFNELTCLRTLALIYCEITEISSAIGRLIHLRSLRLHWCILRSSLPKEVGDLSNLLILDLTDCSGIDTMPGEVEKLSNLRYLLTDECITRLTAGIGRLRALREASLLVDGKSDSLGSLKEMNHLLALHLKITRNARHVDGAKQAQLHKKKHLIRLQLSFDSKEKEEEAEKWKLYDEELVEAFQHFPYLEELEISGYLGTQSFYSWFLSLKHLRKLTLRSWENCHHLPPLGKLPGLTQLCVMDMNKVKRVGVELLGIESSRDERLAAAVAFPKLETLEFTGLGEWEEWDLNDLHGSALMPSLTHLMLWDCGILKALPHALLNNTTLQVVNIEYCPLLRQHYQKHTADWSTISQISTFIMN